MTARLTSGTCRSTKLIDRILVNTPVISIRSIVSHLREMYFLKGSFPKLEIFQFLYSKNNYIAEVVTRTKEIMNIIAIVISNSSALSSTKAHKKQE